MRKIFPIVEPHYCKMHITLSRNLQNFIVREMLAITRSSSEAFWSRYWFRCTCGLL